MGRTRPWPAGRREIMEPTAAQRTSRSLGHESPALAVIPARYASTRFPGKALALFGGRPLVEHVWRRALRIRGCDRVVIATDDERIAAAARGFGAEVCMTSQAHLSGTDRIGEVVGAMASPPELILNLQGDEPLFRPEAVERLLAALRADPDAIWTLADPIGDEEEYRRASVVKVVCAGDGRALYFSRSPIPHLRPGSVLSGPPALPGEGAWTGPLRHVGVYGYSRDVLARFLALPAGRLERAEGLEQLRACEAGIPVKVLLGAWPDAGVDTPDDLERLRARYPEPKLED
jgi:3-deoxy-D-manno-octulosonate cytidylyltransferase